MKCGTSSLHRYLDLHPEIQMSRPKELDFFLGGDGRSWGNWNRGVEWYAGHFSLDAPVRGESSVNYTNLPEASRRTAERMHGVIPDAKLLYMVRDPIDRAVSHYLHARAAGRDEAPASQALADPHGRFVRRSLYHAHLIEFLRFYPRERILVVAQEDLLDRRLETMRRIFRYLDVDEAFSSPQFERMWEVSRGKDRKFTLAFRATRRFGRRRWDRLPTNLRWLGERVVLLPVRGGLARPALEDALQEMLVERFRDDVERLRKLTGQEFATWSV